MSSNLIMVLFGACLLVVHVPYAAAQDIGIPGFSSGPLGGDDGGQEIGIPEFLPVDGDDGAQEIGIPDDGDLGGDLPIGIGPVVETSSESSNSEQPTTETEAETEASTTEQESRVGKGNSRHIANSRTASHAKARTAAKARTIAKARTAAKARKAVKKAGRAVHKA
ncbi:uncharacterized protein LOC126176389 [Schistocerca cancellata]|uniref:uncharacterized protein LOC126176389 n=1 Tax=Schistocerca cancellata TaxID=274614 RepID=UPI00211930D7|nr:uncharacterized protein LOC126176389 [Schistocerca cancellata]